MRPTFARNVRFLKRQRMSGTSLGGSMTRAFPACLFRSAAAVMLDPHNLKLLCSEERQVPQSLAV